MNEWERELKRRIERPVRPNRPRRAPRRDSPAVSGSAPDSKAPPQCSSWSTYHDKPVRCEQQIGHDRRHYAYIIDEDNAQYTIHKW